MKLHKQGNVIVEYYEELKVYYMMFPDGNISEVMTSKDVEKQAKKWFKKNLKGKGDIGIGSIEWRNKPEKE
jgi:hypothetical protein